MSAKVAALVVAILLAIGVAAWMLLGGGAGSFGRTDRDASQVAAAGDSSGSSGSGESRGVARAGAAVAGNAPPRVLPPRPASGESTVVGTVVEAGTHAPISQAEIVLRHPQAEFAVLATSRADGKFTLDRVPGVVGARVFVSAKGFGPRIIRDVHVPPHDRLDLGAIELARGVPIQGLVLTAFGAPIAGAQVDLIESPALAPGAHQNLVSIFHDLRADDEALDQAVTAADGAFTLPGAAPGKYVVLASKPGWQMRYSRPFTIDAGLAPPELTLRLVEGRALRGVVKDEAGAPVVGAAVAALELDPQNIFLVKSQKTVTSVEGKFLYSSFGPGDVAVIVTAPGYSGASKANLKAGGRDVDLVMRKAARIEGRVYDRASGNGLPDAVIFAMQLGDSIALEETRSGPDGAYVFEAGPTGEKVSVFAKLPGYTMAALAEPAAPRQDNEYHSPWEVLEHDVATGAVVRRDVPMIAGGSLSGRVVDEATGEGIGGADVIVNGTHGLERLGATDPVSTRTGSDGSFAFPAIGAGKVTARAEAAGYFSPNEVAPLPDDPASTPDRPEVASAEISPGGSETGLVIKLRRGAEIDVLVTNPDGAPMPGANVSWMMPDEQPGNTFGPAKRPRMVATDGAGRARLKGVARTTGIVIAARHQLFPGGGDVTIDTTSPPKEVKVVLAAGASLAGILFDVDGNPAADRQVIFQPGHGDVGRAFGEWNWRGLRVVTDAAGKFLFENVPAGVGTLDIEDKRGGEDSAAFGYERDDCLESDAGTASLQDQRYPSAKVTLVSGKREEVQLRLVRTLEITGRLLDAAGRPVESMWIEANPQGAGQFRLAATAADGTYRIGGLPPGTYEVSVTGSQHSPDIPAEVLTRTVAAGSVGIDFRFTK